MKTLRTKPQPCPGCGHKLDALTSTFSKDTPKDVRIWVTVCFYCAALIDIDEQMILHPLTDERLEEIKKIDAEATVKLLKAQFEVKNYLKQKHQQSKFN